MDSTHLNEISNREKEFNRKQESEEKMKADNEKKNIEMRLKLEKERRNDIERERAYIQSDRTEHKSVCSMS